MKILEILRRFGIRPKKKLSQVFLADEKVLRRISDLVKNLGVLHVLEIGAGVGNLTSYLAQALSKGYILSTEIDEDLVAPLKEVQKRWWNVDIVIGDAKQIIHAVRGINVVVGNLPYHITSDLIIEIGRSNMDMAVIMVQREVGERLRARPGSDSYGKLTVFVSVLFEVSVLMLVPSKLFIPRPEVDSVVVLMVRRRRYNEDIAKLEMLTRCLFSYRRKLLAKALRSCFGDGVVECVAKVVGNDTLKNRVFQLSPEQFLEIASTCVELKM